MKTLHTALLTSVLILGACEKAPQPTPIDPTATPNETRTSSELTHVSSSAPANAGATASTPSDAVYLTYHCDNGKSVNASYDNGGEAPAATLVIDDKYYAMYSVVSASGARYASEQGLLPNEGMQWYVKDDEAMLVAMVLDHTANPDDAQVLFRCQLAQAL